MKNRLILLRKKIHNLSSPYYRFAICERKSLVSSTKFPGPGHYVTTLNFLPKSPSYGIRMKDQEKNASIQIPGPGKYEPKAEFIQKRITSRFQ